MKKRFFICGFILLIVIILFSSYKTYKDNLSLDIILFKEQYSIFSFHYFDSQPKENKDIEKIISWSKNTSNFEGYKILDLNKITVEYKSKESRVYYTCGGKKQKSLTMFTFFDYLFNKKEYKFLIGKFPKPIFNCTDLTSDKKPSNEVLLSRFEMYKNEKSLLGSDNIVGKFYKQINSFERKANEKISKPRRLNILWFVYKKGRIKIICRDNFSFAITKKVTSDLEKYFNEIGTEYFDYSLFALRLFEPH